MINFTALFHSLRGNAGRRISSRAEVLGRSATSGSCRRRRRNEARIVDTVKADRGGSVHSRVVRLSIFTRERYHWIGVITVDPSLFCFQRAGTLRTGTALLDFFRQEAEATDFSVIRKQENRQLRASVMLAHPSNLCVPRPLCAQASMTQAQCEHMRDTIKSTLALALGQGRNDYPIIEPQEKKLIAFDF